MPRLKPPKWAEFIEVPVEYRLGPFVPFFDRRPIVRQPGTMRLARGDFPAHEAEQARLAKIYEREQAADEAARKQWVAASYSAGWTPAAAAPVTPA